MYVFAVSRIEPGAIKNELHAKPIPAGKTIKSLAQYLKIVEVIIATTDFATQIVENQAHLDEILAKNENVRFFAAPVNTMAFARYFRLQWNDAVERLEMLVGDGRLSYVKTK